MFLACKKGLINMKIWKVKGDINGRLCIDAENSKQKKVDIFWFHRKNKINDWNTIKVSFKIEKKRIDALPLCNITLFVTNAYLFVCDDYTKEVLEKEYCQLQFLEVEPIENDIRNSSKYYLVKVLDFISGLREEECIYNEEGLFKITKYSFKKEIINHPVFYLYFNSETLPEIYATDDFKNFVEKCGITGFSFEEVFDFDKIERGN